MTFDESLKQLIDETEVPDELLPENIALMLKEKTASEATPAKPVISMNSPTKRKAIFRSAAAVAACAVLTVGILVYTDLQQPETVIDPESMPETKPVSSYSDLYTAVRDLMINSNGDIVADVPTVASASDIVLTTQTSATTAQLITGTEASGAIVASEEIKKDISSKFYLTEQYLPGPDSADILKAYGNNLFYIANGSLYVISSDSGKMTLISKNSYDFAEPVEMYAKDNRLIVVSKSGDTAAGIPAPMVNGASDSSAALTELSDIQSVTSVPADGDTSSTDNQTSDSSADIDGVFSETSATVSNPFAESTDASDGLFPQVAADGSGFIAGTEITAQTAAPDEAYSAAPQDFVTVDVFDISDIYNVRVLTTFRQCGEYTSSALVGNSLFLVSGYQLKPLDKAENLDNYVPTYYIDGNKNYVAAEDIVLPNCAGNANYTIVSGVSFSPDAFSYSTKAVLGMSSNVYCSDTNLYIAGSNKKNDKEYTSVTRFALASGKAEYAASTTVDGLLVSPHSLSEYNGMLRIATNVYDEVNASRSVTVYLLDGSLTPVSALTGILPGQQVESVSFESEFAYVYKPDETVAAAVADLSVPSAPVVMAQTGDVLGTKLHEYSDKYMLGFGVATDENGSSALTLMMFDKSGRNKLFSTKVSDEPSAKSDALYSRKFILIDAERNVIGIPVYSNSEFGLKNQYLLYSFSEETGFALLNTIEYNDISDKYKFNRAAFAGDTFYIASNGRMVSARADSYKVIDILDIQ